MDLGSDHTPPEAVTFDDWRKRRTDPAVGQLPLQSVELIRALKYGRLRIESVEGSRIELDRYHVDNVGLCKTDVVELEIADRRHSQDVEYPDAPVRGMFFRDDGAAVGSPFRMMAYDPRTQQRVLASLRRVVRLTIQPHSPLDQSNNDPVT
jgi:hypothetical protein